MKGYPYFEQQGQTCEEYYRVQAWWATFNAALGAALNRKYQNGKYDAEDLRNTKRAARQVANSVHGRIKKSVLKTAEPSIEFKVGDLRHSP